MHHTAHAAAQPRIEQVLESVAEHVQAVHGERHAQSGPRRCSTYLRPSHGGRIIVADYTNEDSPPGKASLKRYYLSPEELLRRVSWSLR